MGDPETSGIVQHDYHVRGSGSCSARESNPLCGVTAIVFLVTSAMKDHYREQLFRRRIAISNNLGTLLKVEHTQQCNMNLLKQ
ncbi:hypothetical protein PR048_007810 [Dryococelus australis]|uniref:Uncharacterized protein n=1 Tax=Dryococelus australis TaxID=614101 RepID=A0ABQ9HWX7_9NEOP|nr:hypothetical protein PR048_007810 [Dryococelus australis]